MHIACGFAGAVSDRRSGQPLLGKLAWSQTMAIAGTTANAAPASNSAKGDPVFQLRASADSYAALAVAPDATSGARIFVPANETVTVYGEPGDKVAWITA